MRFFLILLLPFACLKTGYCLEDDPLAEDIFLREESLFLNKKQLSAELGVLYVRDTLATTEGLYQRNNVYTDLTFRYGLSQKTELLLTIPLVATYDTVSQNGFQTSSDHSKGVGNVQFGIKTQLYQESFFIPDIVLSITASSPAVDNASPSLGREDWRYNTSLLFVKTVDPAALYLQIGGTHYDDKLYRDDPNWIHSIDYRGGIGFALSDQVVLNTQISGSYLRQIKYRDKTLVSLHPVWFHISTTFVLGKRWYIEPRVSFALTPEAQDVMFGFSTPFIF